LQEHYYVEFVTQQFVDEILPSTSISDKYISILLLVFDETWLGVKLSDVEDNKIVIIMRGTHVRSCSMTFKVVTTWSLLFLFTILVTHKHNSCAHI